MLYKSFKNKEIGPLINDGSFLKKGLKHPTQWGGSINSSNNNYNYYASVPNKLNIYYNDNNNNNIKSSLISLKLAHITYIDLILSLRTI